MNILATLLIALSLPGALLAGLHKENIKEAVFGSGGFTVSNYLSSPLNLAGSDITGTLPVENGGTEATSLSSGDILIGGGTGAITASSTLAVNKGGTGAATLSSGDLLVGAGTGVVTSTSTLAVNKGGTGAATFTDNRILTGNGTGVLSDEANLTFTGSALAVTGTVSISSTLTLTGSTATSTITNALAVGTTTAATTGHKLMIQGSAAIQEIKVATSSSFTIDWNVGNQQFVGLGAATTIAFANGYVGGGYRLIVCQDGTGSRVVTWSGPIAWAGGTAPTLTTTANKCDVLSFLRTNGTSTPIYLGGASANY